MESSGPAPKGGATTPRPHGPRVKRAHRRLMVRFGTRAPEKTAFTRNISDTGMFLQTNTVLKPGTTLQVRFEISNQQFKMWARVVWAKKAPAQVVHLLGSGMGVCFMSPSPEWLETYERWAKENGVYSSGRIE